MAQNTGNAKNILVGASPLFLSNIDITTSGYVENAEPGAAGDYAFESGISFTKTLKTSNTQAESSITSSGKRTMRSRSSIFLSRLYSLLIATCSSKWMTAG